MTEAPTPLVIRADAGPTIGAGHVMRCLALAQEWTQRLGHPTHFVQASGSQALSARLLDEGMVVQRIPVEPGSVDDGIRTAEYALAVGAEWVVSDGYALGEQFHERLANPGLQRLAIDDDGSASTTDVDVILNQNAHAGEHMYGAAGRDTRLLLGTHYALLRNEFVAKRPVSRRFDSSDRRVLLTMGGSDPHDVTSRLVVALEDPAYRDFDVLVVVGGGNPRYEQILDTSRRASCDIEVVHDTTDMRSHMEWADVAISSGGSTVWELAYMGVPTVAGSVVPVERYLIDGLDERAVLHDVGELTAVDPRVVLATAARLLQEPENRRRVSRDAMRVVDGLGRRRVVDVMLGEGNPT